MGGIERHLLALIDHLRERHRITVFCDAAEDDNPFRAELNARGLSPRMVPLRVKETRGVIRPLAKNFPVLLRALSALKSAQLDVIHFHAGRLGLAYAPIAASCAAGIRTRLLTIHNPVMERSPLQRFFEGRMLRMLDHIVAVCDEVKEELVDKKSVAPAQVTVIPNGIDAAEFTGSPKERSAARAALGLPDRSPVVGMVGRLDELKGGDLLIRAAALIRARVPELKVVLIGAGPAEHALKRLAAERGVSDIALFAGYRSDARRLMHALDLLVLPSRYEGQSFSLIEAMACGKPVVAANVGGIPGVLLDGVTGLLFPAEDFAALADSVVKLLAEPEKREEMGRAGRRRVESDFSQAAMLERTLALYPLSGAAS